MALAAKRKKEAEQELEDEEKERVFPLFPRANGETDRERESQPALHSSSQRVKRDEEIDGITSLFIGR